ncbi:hypothetical protein C1H46_045235 [Malus baccata]|uniref:XS domain-containing protein n=1 Tax=Malus baccata TaxID=106549 RepID=A0A540K5S5_MALBA|nr:hypothetical protein C1H46_045235 [Malus baccata]
MAVGSHYHDISRGLIMEIPFLPLIIVRASTYLGFGSGKSKSLYGRDGHLGMTLVKFSGDEAGLKDAIRMAEFFEKENHGRRGWARVQPPVLGSKDDEMNPNLVKFDEKTREKKRILYAYLGTAYDLDKVDFDTRKKVVIESLGEHKSSKHLMASWVMEAGVRNANVWAAFSNVARREDCLNARPIILGRSFCRYRFAVWGHNRREFSVAKGFRVLCLYGFWTEQIV